MVALVKKKLLALQIYMWDLNPQFGTDMDETHLVRNLQFCKVTMSGMARTTNEKCISKCICLKMKACTLEQQQ